MAAQYPIPQDLVDAFRGAIQAFNTWRWEGPVPMLRFAGRPFPFYTIAQFVSVFDQDMPDDIYQTLYSLGNGNGGPEGKTFADGGLYLRRLYEDLREHRAMNC